VKVVARGTEAMMSRISRRKFLFSGVITLVSAAIGGCLPREAMRTPPARIGEVEDPIVDTIVALLQDKFSYLNLVEADLVAFANDFRSKSDTRVLNLQESDPVWFEYEVATQFLMSSDFFRNDADETQPVKYKLYHDPYRGCSSPFARFD